MSIELTINPSTSISVTSQGPKGDTGSTGPAGGTGAAGAAGADGADGSTYAAGGSTNQALVKNSGTDHDTKWTPYTLPAADGADGQLLETNGAGAVSFATPNALGTFSFENHSVDTAFVNTVLYLAIPTAAASSPTSTLQGPSISLGDSIEGTYGTQNSILIRNMTSGQTISYSITLKITTSGVLVWQTSAPVGSTWSTGFVILSPSASEQTVTITGSGVVVGNNSNAWKMYSSLAGTATGNYRISDFSVTVS